MENNNTNSGDYSTLISAEENLFHQYIDILKSWRETLWDTVSKGISSFLISYTDGLYEMQADMSKFKQYVSDEVYEEFLKEYDMTMLLLRNSLIKSTNENLLPSDEEEQTEINELISNIELSLQDKDIESIIFSLRKEDPSTRKALEGLGLPQEKIDEIIASGYTAESVLDISPISELKK